MIYDLAVEGSARPSDWVVNTLAELADVVGGGTPDTGNSEYWNPPEVAWATPTDITACIGTVLTRTERAISNAGLRNCSATLLPRDATLLTSRATIGECRLAGIPIATNQGFASLVPKEGVDPQFLFYLAQSLKRVFTRLAAGTTFIEVSRREIRRVSVCVPSCAEERTRIGEIFAAVDVTLGLSRERLAAAITVKRALMQQLFTKGIPGRHSHHKETKIGAIPMSWELVALGTIATIVSGIALNPEREARFHPRQYLTVVNVQRERLDLSEVRFMEVFPEEVPAALLEQGDIVLVEGHANSSEIGRAAMITEDAAGFAFQNHLFRIRLQPGVTMTRLFLLGVFNSERVRRHWVATCNTSSGLNTINRRGVRRLLIPQPPLGEQEKIADLLESSNQNIARCEDELLAIARLKQSLLQNLLTGKVRVRV